MKLVLVGLWAIFVALGSGYAVASWKVDSAGDEAPVKLEGLRYTSLPTMSVPVLGSGEVKGYVVVRVVYTADAATLRLISAEPDPFISDEVFRTLYDRAEIHFGRLARIDLNEFAETVKTGVNKRLGDDVIQDILVDGLNYIDLATVDAQRGIPGMQEPVASSDRASGHAAEPKGGGH